MTDIRNIKESPATTTSPSGSTAPQREPWEDALKHAFDGMHAPQDVCDAALTAIEDCLRQSGCEGSCHRADAEAREDAHYAGMGVGKYRAAQQLMELDDSVTLDDCAGMTMRELHDRIDACADGAESGRGEHGAHSGAGQGAGKEAGGTNAGAGSHGHHGSDE